MEESSEGIEVVTFQSRGSCYLVYAPASPMMLITTEDPETKLHTIVFEEETDDAAFEHKQHEGCAR